MHLMYIPIVLSSLFWGTYVGLATGVICGMAAGPWMPLDVSSGIMQDPGPDKLDLAVDYVFINRPANRGYDRQNQ